MTLLYSDPRFLDHDTGAQHPERAERLLQVTAHLRRTGLDQLCVRPTWEPATLERLARVHDPAYVASVAEFTARGGGRIEADTVVGPASHDVALLAAGAACDAVTRVVRGDDANAMCLVRPPGHHALGDAPMGFCLYNNVAVAARAALNEWGLDRVLIVDWDVHHGNGTQAMFWTDERVAFFSIHRWPFYPGTGWKDETGSGPGLGATLNLPVEFGVSREDYRALFAAELDRFASRVKPQLVLISAGFDSHRDDPIGSLGLEIEDFIDLTRAVQAVADDHAGGRVVSVLEGGYNTSILAGCVEVHLKELLARSAPT